MTLDAATAGRLAGNGADERSVMTRALAFIVLAGVAMMAVWLTAPHTARANDVALAVVTASAIPWALLLLALPSRLVSGRALEMILAVLTAIISAGIFATGDATTGLELFYVWVTPYAYAFFSGRHAAAQTAWVGVCYGGALAAQQIAWGAAAGRAGELPTRWALTIGTVVIVGALVRRLTGWLRERDARFRSGFEDSPLGVALIGTDLRYIEVNDALCAMHGRSREQLLGLTLDDVSHPDDNALTRDIVTALEQRRNVLSEKRYVRPDGRVVLVVTRTSAVRDRRGRLRYLYSQVEDVTELRRRAAQQEAVARLGQRAVREDDVDALMAEAMATVAAALGTDCAAVYELRDAEAGTMAVRAAHGWDEDAMSRPIHADESTLAGACLRSSDPVLVTDMKAHPLRGSAPIAGRQVVSGAGVVIDGRDGPFGLVTVHTLARREFSGEDANFLHAVAHVLSAALERAVSDAANRHAALHDPLTGLANRTLAADRIQRALARRARDGVGIAVLGLDLDRFKFVNDSLGHAAGDDLLVTVAARIDAALRTSDTVARMGGDEFVVVCEDTDGTHAAAIAQRILDAVRAPITVAGVEHVVCASIGVALATAADDDAVSLVRDADTAMYRVKARGGAGYELFDERLRSEVVARVATERELRAGIDAGELRVHYQPVIDLETRRPVGVEALVRWAHPERGLLSPAEFITVAEESGLIVPLGLWVLEHACTQVAAWQARHGADLHLAVNVSVHQLERPDFAEQAIRIAERSGIAPGTLGIEVTESVLMAPGGAAPAALARLREAGLRLLLDDFGTGYSSLSYLKRFAVDAVKLDRSFVAGVDRDRGDSAIVTAAVRMAQALGLDVVAEGVETERQVECLRALQCPLAQGYLFSRPLDATATGAFLAGARPLAGDRAR